jgi:hypothetical protein
MLTLVRHGMKFSSGICDSRRDVGMIAGPSSRRREDITDSLAGRCRMRPWKAVAVGAILVSRSQPVYGQSAGARGLVFQVPSTIGAIWHVTDAVAIRPEVNFLSVSVSGTDSRALSLAVSAPFYATSVDAVRVYLSPLVGMTRVRNTGGTFNTTITEWSFAVSYGAQYAATKRFGLYAESGLYYARNDFDPTVSQLGLRSAIGVILYHTK